MKMEPFDDRELSEILREWKAPGAPPALRHRVLPPGQARQPFWRWLLTGTIRVPVPIGVAALIVLAVWLYASPSSAPIDIPQVPQATPVTLADFQPVAQLQPRIVGEP